MAPPSLAALVNVVGFLLGTALYGLLLGTVLRLRAAALSASGASSATGGSVSAPASRLLLATGFLGLTWNLGSLWIQIVDPGLSGDTVRWIYGGVGRRAGVPAGGGRALGAGAAARSAGAAARAGRAADGPPAPTRLSTAAALAQAIAAATRPAPLPSPAGLWLLTGGFVCLVLALMVRGPAATREGRPIWVLALSVFAVSALHLGQHTGREAWPTELVGHHASLPLAVAILLRDYRFALADIFLKRALTLSLVVVAIAVVHVTVGLRWLGASADVAVTIYVLGLVLVAVLLQEPARAFGAWVVDTVILRRPDTSALIRAVEAELAGVSDPDAVARQCGRAARRGARRRLDRNARGRLRARGRRHRGARPRRRRRGALRRRQPSLRRRRRPRRAGRARRSRRSSPCRPLTRRLTSGASAPLTGGRRWLSDDVALAESVAFITARRLDALRVAEERYAAALRERQIGQLATEAELRALRAQLNPHFLFNALTTIGYLIQVAPARGAEHADAAHQPAARRAPAQHDRVLAARRRDRARPGLPRDRRGALRGAPARPHRRRRRRCTTC